MGVCDDQQANLCDADAVLRQLMGQGRQIPRGASVYQNAFIVYVKNPARR
jgi:hypothetical protein